MTGFGISRVLRSVGGWQTTSASGSNAVRAATRTVIRLRPPSGFVELQTDAVYPVRRDANGAGVRLRQLEDQEHRARHAKGPERRHSDGRGAGFRVQPGQKKRNAS